MWAAHVHTKRLLFAAIAQQRNGEVQLADDECGQALACLQVLHLTGLFLPLHVVAVPCIVEVRLPHKLAGRCLMSAASVIASAMSRQVVAKAEQQVQAALPSLSSECSGDLARH